MGIYFLINNYFDPNNIKYFKKRFDGDFKAFISEELIYLREYLDEDDKIISLLHEIIHKDPKYVLHNRKSQLYYNDIGFRRSLSEFDNEKTFLEEHTRTEEEIDRRAIEVFKYHPHLVNYLKSKLSLDVEVSTVQTVV